MDEATAATRLEAMTAWDSEPTLTSGQITALLAATLVFEFVALVALDPKRSGAKHADGARRRSRS